MSLAQPGVMLGGASASGVPAAFSRCWVVGCGLLGSRLLACARAAGWAALGIDPVAPADVQGDAADGAVLARARALLVPEVIFCTAATHGGDEAAYRSVYLELPQVLQAACPSARLVLCSSSSVYGGQGGEWVEEVSPCRAVSARAAVLLAAEAAVLGMGGAVARLVPLYGGGRCELLRRFVQRGPELAGEEARWLNYVHVEDAARGLLCFAGQAGGGPRLVNICGECFTKGGVYAGLSRLTGLPRVGCAGGGGCRGVSHQRVCSGLLRSLGWQPQQLFLDWAARHWQVMG